MEYLFTIPLILSIYFVSKGEVEKAFLNVYLPSVFVVPHYLGFRIPHLPPISACEGALIPIAVAVFMRPPASWKFRRMDLWVGLFILSTAISEVTRENNPKDGFILWLNQVIQMGVPYFVARQLIEPKLRMETVKRIVFLLVCLAPFILMEVAISINPWLRITQHLFGDNYVGWFVQMRGGHARVAACFGHAILAGIVFGTVIALNYFLVQVYKSDKTRLGPWMSMLQRYRIPFLLIPLYLVATGSRGPMMSAALCFLIMQIPKFKSLLTGTIVVVLVLGIGGGAVYSYFQKYTSVTVSDDLDEAQKSAIYRKEMLTVYGPVLEQGGLFGWGALSHPILDGMTSMDNNYMLVQFSYGKIGCALFYIIAFDSFFSLVHTAIRFKSRESLSMVFCMIGGLVGIFVSLQTVYLGEQLTEILFLLLGWSQSLQDTSPAGATVNILPEPKFRFRRVIA